MTITISVPFAVPSTLLRVARVLFPVVVPLALAMAGSPEAGVGLQLGLEIALVVVRHMLGA